MSVDDEANQWFATGYGMHDDFEAHQGFADADRTDPDFARYLKCWKYALRELLGWSDSKTEAWAKAKYSDSTWLTHQTAMWWITSLLVPEKLKRPGALRGESLLELERRIQNSIDHGSTVPEMEQIQRDRIERKQPPEEGLARLERVRDREFEAGNWLWALHPEKYNWKAGRERINKILAEYGESLPEVN